MRCVLFSFIIIFVIPSISLLPLSANVFDSMFFPSHLEEEKYFLSYF